MVKLDLDLDPDPHSEKLLDPDPHKMNADPQPWLKSRLKSGSVCRQIVLKMESWALKRYVRYLNPEMTEAFFFYFHGTFTS